jgi:NTP pyrophosphatase (non-canonical NTP hydrolase)
MRLANWADTIFTQATPVSIATHMGREVEEVRETAESFVDTLDGTMAQTMARQDLAEELADVLHLLFHLAWVADIDLEYEFEWKFQKNQRRTWKAPDHEGVVEHDEEG